MDDIDDPDWQPFTGDGLLDLGWDDEGVGWLGTLFHAADRDRSMDDWIQ